MNSRNEESIKIILKKQIAEEAQKKIEAFANESGKYQIKILEDDFLQKKNYIEKNYNLLDDDIDRVKVYFFKIIE